MLNLHVSDLFLILVLLSFGVCVLFPGIEAVFDFLEVRLNLFQLSILFVLQLGQEFHFECVTFLFGFTLISLAIKEHFVVVVLLHGLIELSLKKVKLGIEFVAGFS